MRSIEYPKTENLLERSDYEDRPLLMGTFRVPEHRQIGRWHVTEKIDGTNMRILYDPETHTFDVRGRSDRAKVPGDLEDNIRRLLYDTAWKAAFQDFCAPRGDRLDWGTVTIFGEGYGPGIQRGHGYAPQKSFRMFDVMYHWPDGRDSWCSMETVEMLAAMLRIPTAPLIGRAMTTLEILDYVLNERNSFVAAEDNNNPTHPSEGVIARTNPYVYTERGSRVMFKLKGADLDSAV